MNRILYTSFLLGAGFTCIKAQSSTPPNIVLILCDDMGFSRGGMGVNMTIIAACQMVMLRK